MKYITSLIDGNGDIKHIVEIRDRNTELLIPKSEESYGNKRGQKYCVYNDLRVYSDLTFRSNLSNGIHLANAVMAIELVKFVLDETKRDIFKK